LLVQQPAATVHSGTPMIFPYGRGAPFPGGGRQMDHELAHRAPNAER
jgi:hypothetical protein